MAIAAPTRGEVTGAILRTVDDLAIGRVLRELRIRRGWRASDVAVRAGVSRTTYGRIERGQLDRCRLASIRRVAAALEVRLTLEPRWRGAGLDRVLSARHAAMSEAVTRLLGASGWEVRPEVSFSHFGERGVVDLVAWHERERALLLVELKTELADVHRLLEVTDRRRRLAHVISQPLGWVPTVVGQWVVIANGRTNHRRVSEHVAVLRAAFPADGRSVASWLRHPAASTAALWFLPDAHVEALGRRPAPTHRVRVAGPRLPRPKHPAV